MRPPDWPTAGRHRLQQPSRTHRLPRIGRRHAAAGAVLAVMVALIPAGLADTQAPVLAPAAAAAAEIGTAAVATTTPRSAPRWPVQPRTAPTVGSGNPPATPEGSQAATDVPATATASASATATTSPPAPTPAPTTTRPAPSRAPWPPNCGATT